MIGGLFLSKFLENTFLTKSTETRIMIAAMNILRYLKILSLNLEFLRFIFIGYAISVFIKKAPHWGSA